MQKRKSIEKGEKEGVRLPFSSQSSLHPCKLVHWVKQAEAFVGFRLASSFNFNLSVLPQSLYLCNFCTLWEDMQDRDVVQCNWSRFSLSTVQCRSCWIGDVDVGGGERLQRIIIKTDKVINSNLLVPELYLGWTKTSSTSRLCSYSVNLAWWSTWALKIHRTSSSWQGVNNTYWSLKPQTSILGGWITGNQCHPSPDLLSTNTGCPNKRVPDRIFICCSTQVFSPLALLELQGEGTLTLH